MSRTTKVLLKRENPPALPPAGLVVQPDERQKSPPMGMSVMVTAASAVAIDRRDVARRITDMHWRRGMADGRRVNHRGRCIYHRRRSADNPRCLHDDGCWRDIDGRGAEIGGEADATATNANRHTGLRGSSAGREESHCENCDFVFHNFPFHWHSSRWTRPLSLVFSGCRSGPAAGT